VKLKKIHYRKTIKLSGEDANIRLCDPTTSSWQIYETSGEWVDVTCFNCWQRGGMFGNKNHHKQIKEAILRAEREQILKAKGLDKWLDQQA
jgi:hypothetical protein